jgi:poly(3-hydroxybutyrate) depolymerase
MVCACVSGTPLQAAACTRRHPLSILKSQGCMQHPACHPSAGNGSTQTAVHPVAGMVDYLVGTEGGAARCMT